MRSIIILALLASTADARIFCRSGRCNVRVVRRQVVQQVQQIVPVAPLAFVLAPGSLTQPSSYGTPDYQPPAVAQRQSSSSSSSANAERDKLLTQLVSIVQELSGRVSALEGGTATPQIVQQHCSKCHTGSEAEGGVTIADILGPLNLKAQLAVHRGTMPRDAEGKPVPLPTEVRNKLLAFLQSKEPK